VGGIRSGLIANHIEALHGILNGTANYILTEMTQRDRPYREALEDAQAKGYAEADPTLDVDGTDSAHKLAILGAIAFSKKSDMDAIYVEGIDDLDLADLKFASELGYVTKLLAIGERLADGLSLRVHPALIRRDHPLAAVNGSFNAVSVVGRPIGHTLFYGRGAGRGPTASAVVADLVDVALGNGLRSFRDLHHLPDQTESVSMAPIDRITCRYYLRFNALDRPGTIAKVSGILGDHAISISGVSQHEQGDGEYVPLVVLTNPSQEGNVQDALQKIDELDVAKHPSKVIRIVEPKHEDLE
jgi:homoserine dehydrogenase